MKILVGDEAKNQLEITRTEQDDSTTFAIELLFCNHMLNIYHTRMPGSYWKEGSNNWNKMKIP